MCTSDDSQAPTVVPGFGDRPDYRTVHLGADKASDYDRDFHDTNTAKGLYWQLEQRLLDAALRRFVRSRPRVAVDFACGTGRVLQFLETRVDRSIGIDISPDMLALARARCTRSELIQGDVTRGDVGLAAGSVSLVTAFRFFLNAEPPLRSDALTWIREVLEPGGWLIANFHLNPNSVRGRYLWARWGGRHRTPMLSPSAAHRLLTAAGFHVVGTFGYDILPYRKDGAHWHLPRTRARIESALAGRPRLASVAGSFLVIARRPDTE